MTSFFPDPVSPLPCGLVSWACRLFGGGYGVAWWCAARVARWHSSLGANAGTVGLLVCVVCALAGARPAVSAVSVAAAGDSALLRYAESPVFAATAAGR